MTAMSEGWLGSGGDYGKGGNCLGSGHQTTRASSQGGICWRLQGENCKKGGKPEGNRNTGNAKFAQQQAEHAQNKKQIYNFRKKTLNSRIKHAKTKKYHKYEKESRG